MTNKTTRRGFTQEVRIGQVKPDVKNSQGGDSRLQHSGMTALYNVGLAPNLYRGLRSGFTLIELLVVVVIIAILAAIALPQYQKAVEKSQIAEIQTFLNAAEKALNLYVLDHGFPSDQVLISDLDIDLVSGWTKDQGNNNRYWNPRKDWTADGGWGTGIAKYPKVGLTAQKGPFGGIHITAGFTGNGDFAYSCNVGAGTGATETKINLCQTLAGDDPRWMIWLPS